MQLDTSTGRKGGAVTTFTQSLGNLALAATVFLGGTVDAVESRISTYRCDDASGFTAEFVGAGVDAAGGGRVILRFPDGSVVVLPQQPAASGFLYATPQHALRGKDNVATYTIGRRTPVNCETEPAVALIGSEWQAIEIDGQLLATADSRQVPTLTLDEGGKTHGFAGCNRYFGDYDASGDRLSFKPLALTKMACLDPKIGHLEARFVRMLQATVAATIADGVLELKDAAGKLLGRFIPRTMR